MDDSEPQDDNEANITLSGASEAIDNIDMEQRVIDLESKVIELQSELEKANQFKTRVKPITELFRCSMVNQNQESSFNALRSHSSITYGKLNFVSTLNFNPISEVI